MSFRSSINKSDRRCIRLTSTLLSCSGRSRKTSFEAWARGLSRISLPPSEPPFNVSNRNIAEAGFELAGIRLNSCDQHSMRRNH